MENPCDARRQGCSYRWLPLFFVFSVNAPTPLVGELANSGPVLNRLPFALKAKGLHPKWSFLPGGFQAKAERRFDQLSHGNSIGRTMLFCATEKRIGNFNSCLHACIFPYLWIANKGIWFDSHVTIVKCRWRTKSSLLWQSQLCSPLMLCRSCFGKFRQGCSTCRHLCFWCQLSLWAARNS